MPGEKSAAYCNQLLQLLFNAQPIPGVAANATSGALTNLYIALHTGDPGAGGNQATNEISYTGYARVAIARTTGGWVVTGSAVSPQASIVFPVPTGSPSATATWWSVGSASSGSAQFFYAGPVSPAIVVTAGIPPNLTPASTWTES